jgi:hypothetical protein
MNTNLLILIGIVIIYLFYRKYNNKTETFIEDRENGHTYISTGNKKTGIINDNTTHIMGDLHIAKNARVHGGIFLNKYNQPLLPRGMIMMWGGHTKDIPIGWALCDGKNGTPNLLGRFIASISPSRAHWQNPAPHNPPFGSGIVKLHPNNIPPHSHSATINVTDTNHQHTGRTNSMNRNHVHSHRITTRQDDWNDSGGAGPSWGDGDNGHFGAHHGTTNTDTNHEHDFRTSWMDRNNAHTHGITIKNSGLGHAFDARPYFYTLAFIMKL